MFRFRSFIKEWCSWSTTIWYVIGSCYASIRHTRGDRQMTTMCYHRILVAMNAAFSVISSTTRRNQFCRRHKHIVIWAMTSVSCRAEAASSWIRRMSPNFISTTAVVVHSWPPFSSISASIPSIAAAVMIAVCIGRCRRGSVIFIERVSLKARLKRFTVATTFRGHTVLAWRMHERRRRLRFFITRACRRHEVVSEIVYTRGWLASWIFTVTAPSSLITTLEVIRVAWSRCCHPTVIGLMVSALFSI